MPVSFPISATPSVDVLAKIEEMQSNDVHWRDGRAFAYVYYADSALESLLGEAYLAGASTNGLSRSAFPSLGQMEDEILEMVGDLLGCPDPDGSITSGGSESIFLAVKTARDRASALHPDADSFHIVLPASAHPAFSKAAHFLRLETTRVPVDARTLRADPVLMVEAIRANTVLMVVSAPSYPHGVVDPITELAAEAAFRNILCHVDACVGGMLLPFVGRLGRTVPNFDFSVPGVTSMSVDLHKFGYTAKGASLVLYRDPSIGAYQRFIFDDWSGGKYSAPNLTGTRPGGPIAAAWAGIQYLGLPGYLQLVRRALAATQAILDGIDNIPGLFVLGSPDATLVAFGSAHLSLKGVVEEMSRRGWVMGLQGPPLSIHLTVTASHDRVVDELLSDLRDACRAAVAEPEAMGEVGRYS